MCYHRATWCDNAEGVTGNVDPRIYVEILGKVWLRASKTIAPQEQHTSEAQPPLVGGY